MTQKERMQQALDIVYTSIIRQGRASVGQGGACQYRSNDGCKCAIGWLMTDEEYDPSFEDCNFTDLVSACSGDIDIPEVIAWGKGDDEAERFLEAMQGAHDNAAFLDASKWHTDDEGNPVRPRVTDAEFIEDFKGRMAKIAATFGLEPPITEYKTIAEAKRLIATMPIEHLRHLVLCVALDLYGETTDEEEVIDAHSATWDSDTPCRIAGTLDAFGLSIDESTAGDDLCDKCGRSGVQVGQTDDEGNTVCGECAASEEV